MRFLAVLLLCTAAVAQQPVELALIGDWAGYLEYRDYSEPATSTKRVQLPTWLNVSYSAGGLTLHYIYDDGPSKVVDETEKISLDPARATYTIAESGHLSQIYMVEGFGALKGGLGTLTLSGLGIDNDKPAEQRIRLTIRRNLVEWLLESRPAQSSEAFAFRHLYRFTRTQAPAVTAPRK